MNSEAPPQEPNGDSHEPAPAGSTPQPGGQEPRIATWIKIVGGILGIAVAATTLYFLIFPRSESCTGARSGTFGAPIVDVGVPYRDFLRLTNQDDPGATPATLERLGTMIDAPIAATGYDGKELPVRWTTLTRAGREVPETGQTDQLALEFVPEDCSDSGRRKLWAPWPSAKGDYLVEVSLLDDDDELLDTLRTPVFTVPKH